MSQARKTRQQKIQQSQRKPKPVRSEPVSIPTTAIYTPEKAINREVADTQLYVVDELKRIGWITIICAVILLLATLFLADFTWVQAVRDSLPF